MSHSLAASSISLLHLKDYIIQKQRAMKLAKKVWDGRTRRPIKGDAEFHAPLILFIPIDTAWSNAGPLPCPGRTCTRGCCAGSPMTGATPPAVCPADGIACCSSVAAPTACIWAWTCWPSVSPGKGDTGMPEAKGAALIGRDAPGTAVFGLEHLT